jgi:hypothetical protein
MSNKDHLILTSIITQLQPQKIDYQVLADYIGVGTPKAAWHRWDKFKKNPSTQAKTSIGGDKLLSGVLVQVGVGKIDYDMLAKDIGVGTPKAAWHRWDKLRKRLGIKGPRGGLKGKRGGGEKGSKKGLGAEESAGSGEGKKNSEVVVVESDDNEDMSEAGENIEEGISMQLAENDQTK